MQRGELLSAVGGDLFDESKDQISHFLGGKPRLIRVFAFSLLILIKAKFAWRLVNWNNFHFKQYLLLPSRFDINTFTARIRWVKNEQGHAAGQFHIAFKNKDVVLSNFPPQVRKENSSIDILPGATQQKNIFHIENIQQRFHKNTSFTCVFGERFNLEVSKIRKSF